MYRSGYAETLTDTLDLPAIKQSPEQAALARPTDPDDSFLITERMGVKQDAVGKLHLDDDMVACGKPGASMKLSDGSTMVWTDKPGKVLEAGTLYNLKFAIADPTAKPPCWSRIWAWAVMRPFSAPMERFIFTCTPLAPTQWPPKNR